MDKIPDQLDDKEKGCDDSLAKIVREIRRVYSEVN